MAAAAIARVGGTLLRDRRLVRAPIWLYRARLGFLLGSRMLLLEHVGRVSGARRYAVLEVVDHPARDTYVVASGFGTRAQWFRNVRANPRVRISVAGHGLADATARVLTTAEADQVLAAYITRHPRAWDAFRGVLESTLGRPVVSHDAELPMVELRLDSR